MEIISNGDFVPIGKEGDKIVLKPRSDFSKEETKKVVKKLKRFKYLIVWLGL